MISGITAKPDMISVLDRGLSYGDGLFETFAVSDGRPCHWQAHMERLLLGCERLGIPKPDVDALKAEALTLCTGSDETILKLILTRGSGGRGYRAPDPTRPWHGFSLHPRPLYPDAFRETGITARICHTRLGQNPALAGIKHLNRLEQVLARNEWSDGFQEGLMLDTESCVIEGTMSNLFLITQEGLVTPDLTQCGIAGVIRGRIIAWSAQQGLACRIRNDITLEEVFKAEALILTNSVIGIWPVKQLEENTYTLDNELLHHLLRDDPAQCAD